jgi:hypothetical protein
VWGPSRMEIVGGLWNDTQTYEYRKIARYTQQSYVLEKWVAPFLYGSPQIWNEQNRDSWGYLSCGAYPHKGDYETVHIFQDEGTYYSPVPALVRAIILNVERGNLFSLSDRRSAMKARKEEDIRRHEQKISDEFDECMPLHYGPTMGYGGATKTADLDSIKLGKASDLPASVRRAGDNSFSQV